MKPLSATTSQSASAATGLACFFLWLVVHSSLFRFQRLHVAIGAAFEYEAFSIAVNAVILFALFFAYLRRRAVPFGRAYFAAIGVCLLLGYLMGP